MKKNSSNVLNILIALGVLFLILVMLISLRLEAVSGNNILYLLFLVFLISVGALILNNTIILTHKGFHFFMGLLFVGWGILFLLINTIIPYTLFQCWPLFACLSGGFLVAAGVYKYKKIKFGFLMPSIVLIGIGSWYLLFSFKIIKVPFIKVSYIFGPVFFVIVACCLVGFFKLQQNHKELVVNDDEGVFSDEEMILEEETYDEV